MVELKVGHRYLLGPKIGNGAFGDIYLGRNSKTNQEVAIKLESVDCRSPRLRLESRIYRILHGQPGIPEGHWYGVEGKYNVLVMELLGPSIEDLLNYCRRFFSLKTVLMLGEQMVTILETLHSRGLLHRDVKPDNFLIGMGSKASQIHVVDFGLSKKYRNSKSNEHIPMVEGKNLIGTARYASINAHEGLQQSRRDDLEGLAYCLIYLMNGSLPWSAVSGSGRNEKIKEMKQDLTPDKLCIGLPREFDEYLKYVRGLQFEETPDYSHIRGIFRGLAGKEGLVMDYGYDWMNRIVEGSSAEVAIP